MGRFDGLGVGLGDGVGEDVGVGVGVGDGVRVGAGEGVTLGTTDLGASKPPLVHAVVAKTIPGTSIQEPMIL